mgnify:CR=1 FL=1
MTTLDEIKGLSNIHNLPKAIHVNKHIMLDPYLDINLSDSPKTITYDFDVFLKDYGVNLQRPYVWNPIQQQEFILSILLEKPIPPVVLVEIDTDESISGKAPRKMLVIDGKQRLLTIKRFINNEFPITIKSNPVYFKDFDKELHIFFIRRITDLVATVYYASDNPEDEWYISDDMKITLFNFYNFAGTPQEASHKDMLEGMLHG